jgi:hypothetical protein
LGAAPLRLEIEFGVPDIRAVVQIAHFPWLERNRIDGDLSASTA